MKVLMLAPWKAAIVQRLIRELEQQGVEVILASHNVGEGDKIEDLGPIKSIFSYFQVLKVNQLIKKHKPDLIHAHGATHYGVMASLQCKVPYVLALWGSEVMVSPVSGAHFKRLFFHSLLKLSVTRAKVCHSSSNHVCEKAATLANCSMDKFRSFFWGVIPDEILIPPTPEEKARWESAYPQLIGKRFILSGRGVRGIYQPDKVASMIINNAESLIEKKLVFVVLRGYSTDYDVKQFLQRLKGFESLFVFIDQELNDRELAYFYHNSVAHISIPLSDSLGGGVVEPAMHGSYALLSDLPGNRSFLEACEGSIVNDENIHKLKLENMNKSTREERAELARHAFGKDTVVASMMSVYADSVEV